MIIARLETSQSHVNMGPNGEPRTQITNLLGMAPPEPWQGRASFFVKSLSPEDIVVRPHFHQVDQFQVFTGGDGHIGRHAIKPTFVHYVDAYKPYGPIVSGPLGFQYVTIRASGDPGPQYMPDSRALRKRVHGRYIARQIADIEVGAPTVVEPPHSDGLAIVVSTRAMQTGHLAGSSKSEWGSWSRSGRCRRKRRRSVLHVERLLRGTWRGADANRLRRKPRMSHRLPVLSGTTCLTVI